MTDAIEPVGKTRNFAGTPRVALVTCRAARGLDEDMPPLLAAFDAVGASAEIVDWDDGEVDWARFDLALLRSAWITPSGCRSSLPGSSVPRQARCC